MTEVLEISGYEDTHSRCCPIRNGGCQSVEYRPGVVVELSTAIDFYCSPRVTPKAALLAVKHQRTPGTSVEHALASYRSLAREF